jgi:hypothetical protein
MRLLATLSVSATLTVLASSAAMGVDRDTMNRATGNTRPSLGHENARSGETYEINDLRAEIGLLPNNTSTSGGGRDVEWDSNVRIGVQAIRSMERMGDYGGLIYGGEVSLNFASDPQVDMTTEVVTGMVGWGYKLQAAPGVHFEGTPFLGLGFAQLSAAGGNDANSLYYEYGLRVAAFYTFENLWQLGADLRLFRNHVSPDFGSGNIDINTGGPAILFEAGKRF